MTGPTRNLLQQEPGLENRHANAAGIQNTIQRKALCHNGFGGMNPLQILYLRRLHGLTEAQAQAMAALIWGACQ